MTDEQARRDAMVQRQLVERAITDPRVLAAFRAVPRHRFVPEALRQAAYDDHPLPIGHDQTISQPHVVAYMLQALTLRPMDRVLEVGAGSGYAAALLAQIVAEVIAIERLAPLAQQAAETLAALGYRNVVVRVGDGSIGYAEGAPFDAICVSAAAPELPAALIEQLAPGGRLVAPIGGADGQTLVRVREDVAGNLVRESLGPVRFVPLVGLDGWPP